MIKYVFIAGPHSGNSIRNTRHAIDLAENLMMHGFVPYCPHLYTFWDIIHPHAYQDWMNQTLAWLEKCDAVIRMEGDSSGADREVGRAMNLNLPVYFSWHDFYHAVVKGRGPKQETADDA